ncbi:helix-turn-helix transcriptional regulator [Methylobacterium sp. J-001]|uniref:helix-turn-helix transcriptional regulator n=1 Tax=Methylobacterium sp. J-001 TaxID=2836609 RepID=UPI001FB8EE11|nr:helix-turn-helix transcriptional regulator [Methylobacterium sp. J-001]MCJ2120630.1 helix-turn-helix transcriptional regulator [Methylobacterium sp. J-001]
MLQDLFGFTPAEAALATDILAGHDLAASAARRRITVHTARAHLRRLFEKTGTNRQAELMRLLLLLLCPLPVPATAETNPQPTRFSTQYRSNE